MQVAIYPGMFFLAQ